LYDKFKVEENSSTNDDKVCMKNASKNEKLDINIVYGEKKQEEIRRLTN
jgi:hypothetical protein